MKYIGFTLTIFLAGFLIFSCSRQKPLVKPPQEEQETPRTQAPETEAPTTPPEVKMDELTKEEEANLQMIHFEFDKYRLTEEAKAVLDENARSLRANSGMKIRIEGHCDERGTVEYNLALGEKRAQAAKNYLVSLGIAENRITIISYGKERPLDPSSNEDAWAKNRRDEFIILVK